MEEDGREGRVGWPDFKFFPFPETEVKEEETVLETSSLTTMRKVIRVNFV